MIQLYRGSGSGELEILGEALSPTEWNRIRSQAARLLRARKSTLAAVQLEAIPFEIRNGTNSFGDEFVALYCSLPLEEYVSLGEKAEDKKYKDAFRDIAETICEIGPYVRFIAFELDAKTGPEPVTSPNLQITSDSVERALADAEQLIHTRGATSGIDRVHTVFQGFLIAGCVKHKIDVPRDASITALFKLLRENNLKLSEKEMQNTEIDRVLKGMATIIDALNPLRNRASLAHANEELLDEPEAMLVINSIRTLLHYLNSRLQ